MNYYETDDTTDPDDVTPHSSLEIDDDNGWDVGINEDTGNTVSSWPAGRYFDNGTGEEVTPA